MTDLSTVSDADLMASLPRGVRNNNPLNVEDGAFARSHPGYAGSDGRFAKFDTMDAGLAAADHNLQGYHTRHGLNTVAGIVNRWAPPVENDTGSYVRFVAKKAGVDPNAPLDMANPGVRQALLGAMAEHENGVPVTAPKAADLSQVSDADLLASLDVPAAAPKPGGRPAVPQRTAPLRPDDALGFLKGAYTPVDNASRWMEKGLRALPGGGQAQANVGADLRKMLPSGVVSFIDNPASLYEAQAKKGVRPGKLGEFGGNVLTTSLATAGMNPLAAGGVGGALLSDSDTVGGVARDAGVGALTGRATAAVSDAAQVGVRKVLSKVPQVMDLPALKTAVQAAYKAVDDSGFRFSKDAVKSMADDFASTVKSSALSKSAKDDAHSIISYARDLSKGDLSLADLEKLRGDIYQAMVKKGGDTGRIGTQFRAKIDGMIDAIDDGTVRKARELNSRLQKAGYVDRMSKSADIRAEKDYGGDYGRKVKDRLFPAIDPANPNKNLRGATPDEVKALKKVVTGTKTQNAASTLGGMMDPRRMGGKILAGITTTGGGAGAIPSGGLSLLAPALTMATGFGLTGTASKIARKNVADLIDLIAAGGSKQAVARVPTKASHAAEVLVSRARPALTAAAVPALAAARKPPQKRKGDR